MYSHKRKNAHGWIRYLSSCLYLQMVFIFLSSCATNKVYKHPEWRTFKEKHKTLAVLPFAVSYTFDQKPKRLSEGEIQALEQKAGKYLRQDIYTQLLTHRAGNRVHLQATTTTDSVLKLSDITHLTTDGYKKLGALLSVDGVFKVEVSTHYFRSEIEALAIMILSIFSVSTKTIKAEAILHDGNTGELVWKYERRFKGGLLDSERKIRKTLKKKITKRFPYK